jgi:hypothetical protein
MRIFSQSYMNRVFGHQMLGNAVVASQMTFTVLANCHVAFRAFEEYALNYRGCKVSDAARNTSFRFMRTLTDSRLVMMSRSPSDEKPKCQVGWTSSVFLRNMRLLGLLAHVHFSPPPAEPPTTVFPMPSSKFIHSSLPAVPNVPYNQVYPPQA